MLEAGDTILFQGDSITDANRDKQQTQANNPAALGFGYAHYTAATLLAGHPDKNLSVHNRGVSGNNVQSLADRWQRDCLDIEPNVLSILIGVNDTWHGTAKGNPNGGTSLETYEHVYRQIIEQAKNANPKLKLVLCEPFVLRCGAVGDSFFPEIDERRAITKRLAHESGATFVAFQSAFDEATKQASPDYWLFDGVHPSPAGHMLMTRTWLNAVGA